MIFSADSDSLSKETKEVLEEIEEFANQALWFVFIVVLAIKWLIKHTPSLLRRMHWVTFIWLTLVGQYLTEFFASVNICSHRSDPKSLHWELFTSCGWQSKIRACIPVIGDRNWCWFCVSSISNLGCLE